MMISACAGLVGAERRMMEMDCKMGDRLITEHPAPHRASPINHEDTNEEGVRCQEHDL